MNRRSRRPGPEPPAPKRKRPTSHRLGRPPKGKADVRASLDVYFSLRERAQLLDCLRPGEKLGSFIRAAALAEAAHRRPDAPQEGPYE